MKKAIIGVLAIVPLLFASCDKESEGLSSIVYFPIVTLNGTSPQFVQLNSTYNDPGAKATVSGKDVNVITSVAGGFRSYSGTNVNTSLSNQYLIKYTASNPEGFTASVDREVYVYKNGDLTTSIEGLYQATVKRAPSQGVVSATAVLKYIMIWKNTDGTYGISDAIGGYYSIGRGYGPTYYAQGLKITAVNIANNQFTFNDPIGVGKFGGALTIVSLTVNALSKQLTLISDWDSGYTFTVTLTQVNP